MACFCVSCELRIVFFIFKCLFKKEEYVAHKALNIYSLAPTEKHLSTLAANNIVSTWLRLDAHCRSVRELCSDTQAGWSSFSPASTLQGQESKNMAKLASALRPSVPKRHILPLLRFHWSEQVEFDRVRMCSSSPENIGEC